MGLPASGDPGRRRALGLLRWSVALALVCLLIRPLGPAAGAAPAAFAAAAALWLAMAATGGLIGRPGPKPKPAGAARDALRGSRRALYGAPGAAALSGVAALGLTGRTADSTGAAGAAAHAPAAAVQDRAVPAPVAGGALHARFHLWRRTAPGNGAPCNILPKAMRPWL